MKSTESASSVGAEGRVPSVAVGAVVLLLADDRGRCAAGELGSALAVLEKEHARVVVGAIGVGVADEEPDMPWFAGGLHIANAIHTIAKLGRGRSIPSLSGDRGGSVAPVVDSAHLHVFKHGRGLVVERRDEARRVLVKLR
jgi:hypothetical protein